MSHRTGGVQQELESVRNQNSFFCSLPGLSLSSRLSPVDDMVSSARVSSPSSSCVMGWVPLGGSSELEFILEDVH